MSPGDLVAGKYRLVKPLGEGAMGAVWSATNELTHKNVAIKFMSAELAADETMRKRLLREASAAGRLSHDNIINVYDVGVTESGSPFLVMELLQGESLSDRLEREGRLSPGETVAIALAIADALEAARVAGVVHRDLKPANVFLQASSAGRVVVKVLDFGVSKVQQGDASATSTGVAIGTPAYMSPEQARGERTVDHRSDVWALGVVIYEMLTGEWPFRGETVYAIVAEIISANAPDVRVQAPEVSQALGDVVSCCLRRDPGLRFQSAGDARAALASCPESGLVSVATSAPLRSAPQHSAPRVERAAISDAAAAATLAASDAGASGKSPAATTGGAAIVGRSPPASSSRKTVAIAALAGVALLGTLGGLVAMRRGAEATTDLAASAPLSTSASIPATSTTSVATAAPSVSAAPEVGPVFDVNQLPVAEGPGKGRPEVHGQPRPGPAPRSGPAPAPATGPAKTPPKRGPLPDDPG